MPSRSCPASTRPAPTATRRSTACPKSFLSITLDGVSNNDNFLRNTDSFFASVTPRQDAVEAVAVTLSAAGAQVGGGAGAVTMAFQTRSGGNRFTGSAYEYYRNPSFNSNYVFNEINHQGKNEVKLNQFGARVGGPIVIPGLYDGHNKAFYFVHYEQIRFPNSFTRTRTVFNPRVVRRLVPLPVRQRGPRGQPARSWRPPTGRSRRRTRPW